MPVQWLAFACMALCVSHAMRLEQNGLQSANVYDCAPGNSCPINMTNAHFYLNMSNIAYCPSLQVENWTCATCNDTSPDFRPMWLAASNYNVAGFYGVTHTRKEIVVAFRGSTNYRNWIVNLNTLTVPYPYALGARVHRGFYNVYTNDFRIAVTAGIAELRQKYPTYTVTVTGHSLGGALAVLCAADLVAREGIPVKQVYTFGSPRIGNLEFAQWFQQAVAKEIVRFTHRHDIVPHVPMFYRHLMKFHHLPREYWQMSTDPDMISMCDDSGEDPWCADSVLLSLSIEDHLNYLGTRLGSHVCIGPNAWSSDPESQALLDLENFNIDGTVSDAVDSLAPWQ